MLGEFEDFMISNH